MITDWTKVKVNLNFAPRAVKGKTKKTNGYGDIRGKQFVPYGYFAWLTGKSGIYCITCKKNNLKYIGSSKEMRNRIAKHFSNLRTNKHPNRHLQADYNKYGLDGFTITILEETNEDLLEKEKQYQLSYGLDSLYNLMISGIHNSDAQKIAWASYDHAAHKTKEYREKMSKLKSNRIGQFDKYDGHKIAEYANSDEACKAVGIAKSTLLGCCNGSKKTGFGYVWHYIDILGNVLDRGKGRDRNIIIRNEDIV